MVLRSSWSGKGTPRLAVRAVEGFGLRAWRMERTRGWPGRRGALGLPGPAPLKMIVNRSPPAHCRPADRRPLHSRAEEGPVVNVIRTAIVLVVVLGVAGCATSPTGRDQLIMFSPSSMDRMGAAAFDEIKAETPAAGAYLSRYVECVADAVVAVLPGEQAQGWEVEVFDEDEPNAFALPGKKIGVYKGLLDVAERQDQLAAVIGHEIGHVLAQHGNERMSSQFVVGAGLAVAEAMMRRPDSNEGRQVMAVLGLGAQVGILLPYGRSHETEADRIGLELMAQAGFDPEASVELWRNMSRLGGPRPPEFLSTHPANETRIRALQSQIPAATKVYRQAREAGRVPDCDG